MKETQETLARKGLAAAFEAFAVAETPARKIGAQLLAQDILKELPADMEPPAFRRALGVSYLAGVNSSAKIDKGRKLSFDTLVLYLAASDNAGVDVCSHATTGCRLACLVGSGRALMEERAGTFRIQRARILKTWGAVWRPDLFNRALQGEIDRAKARAKRAGRGFAVRLNGTSDLDFSDLIAGNPFVQFYDYTKDPRRQSADNYHLTFSFGKDSPARNRHLRQALNRGQKIAIPVVAADVKAALELPETLDFDETDLRFLDGPGKYGILKVKQTSNTSEGLRNGFVLDLAGLKKLIRKLES